MNTNRYSISSFVAALAVLTCVSITGASAQILWQETFSGAGALLNGKTTATGTLQTGSVAWSANSFALDNGAINRTVEGSALLPVSLALNTQYMLSMDIVMPVGVSNWVGLGFRKVDISTPGGDSAGDRLSQQGLSWLLFRDDATQADEIQIFAGLSTAGQIVDSNPTITFGVSNTLSILVDTTGDGSSFSANFFLNGVSITSTGNAVVIAQSVSDLNFVGFSYDDTASTAPSVDNFVFSQVPEPGVFAMFFGGITILAFCRRRRI